MLLKPFGETTSNQRPDGLIEDTKLKHISIIAVARTDDCDSPTPSHLAPSNSSAPGSARWAHQSLPVTLPEESKLVTTRLSSSQVRTTRVLSPSGFFIYLFLF